MRWVRYPSVQIILCILGVENSVFPPGSLDKLCNSFPKIVVKDRSVKPERVRAHGGRGCRSMSSSSHH